MPFPKLTPLQSRFAASLVAFFVLLVLYLSLTQPHFAYAAELDSRIHAEDHNHYMLHDHEQDVDTSDAAATGEGNLFEQLVPRAAVGVSALANNDPQNMNIDIGETQNWVFPQEAIDGPNGVTGPGLPSARLERRGDDMAVGELKRRQATKKVYITLNTCLQPSSNTSTSDSDVIPPQLQMFVSLSGANQKPGPGSTKADQQTVEVVGGYALAEVNASSDVYVGVAAPNTSSFSGIWNYEVAASIDAPYHGADASGPNLHFVDGDNHAALLITNDTTQAAANSTVYQEWMSLKPPYGVFAQNQNDRAILGVQYSYCGLQNNARVVANLDNVQNQNVATMTNRGLGGNPKEQFYITGLNASSTYWGFLAMEGNSTASGAGVVGGGGMVWAAINFTTKSSDNCALMYNLSFCSEVAYAVPTNPDKFSPTTGLPDLAALYDSYAASMYQYFNYSLQQIPCNTTSSAQYSLVRDCDDCVRAYKQWLCAVTIPRCEDYSNTDPWLMPRNVGQPFINGSTIGQFGTDQQQQALVNAVATNSSRNPIIDQDIQPGPYKEVLPCQDLCYDLVQSCPAALGFGCPSSGRGLEESYGTRSSDPGNITCSYLGAAYYLSGAEKGLRFPLDNAIFVAFAVVALHAL